MIMNDTMPDLADVSDQIETVTSSEFGAVVLAGAGPIAVEFMSHGWNCNTSDESNPIGKGKGQQLTI